MAKLIPLRKGIQVLIDKVCSETKYAYGLNDDMRRNFLGKIGEVVIASRSSIGVVKVQLLDLKKSKSIWSFHRKDVTPVSAYFPNNVEKPIVKETKFDPDYL